MSTPPQISANRTNAQASTGPRTEQGKARAAANSRTFGLFSTRNLVAPHEEVEYHQLQTTLLDELRPATVMEQAFTSEILRSLWRLRRCALVEAALSATPQPDSDPGQLAVDRARAQTNAALRRATAELRRLQTEREVRGQCGGPSDGLVSHKDVLAARLLQSRVEEKQSFQTGLQRLENLVEQSAAKITNRTQSATAEAPPATPRNAPCPCGSGQKHKRCCGRAAPPCLAA